MSQVKNYIYPFFWQHGEEEIVLRQYMEKIEEAGIKAVCVESRPHPDFMGQKWWQDMRVIVDEARNRQMKVWILDDAHFPTGFANGAVNGADERLKKWHLSCKVMDVRGPLRNHRYALATMLGVTISFDGPPKIGKEELVAVIADRRLDENGEETAGELIDVTEHMKEGYLEWDVPDGIYRIYTITKKLDACSDKNDYINLLEADSVKLLLDAVYEPHYEELGDEFGKTIAGFFSDEPGFYNSGANMWDYELKPGRPDMLIPWSESMMTLLEEETGFPVRNYLPCLWYPCGEKTEDIRYHYMNLVTRLYSLNFSRQIGDWCHAHHVEYIGHVLEDNNVHMRLGSGTGHYFRAMEGQDMAGVDVIMSQVMPGNDYGHYYMASPNGLTDGAFYHYGLAKLGASMGHINPKMKGRSLVEIFGAYGWFCGVTLMKWLTDHMLVRGINNFVPHAFSPAPFPDPDCPPHFYAGGSNPQYPYMEKVFRYMNRMSDLLSDGKSAVKVAVLYPAEGEWVGTAMPFHVVGKELMQHQIDFDVIPFDYLDAGNVRDGIMKVGMGTYKCIFVPQMEKLPSSLMKKLESLDDSGFPVYFINSLPQIYDNASKKLKRIIPLKETVQTAALHGADELHLGQFLPHLRYYHYIKNDKNIYIFFNEDITASADFEADIPECQNCVSYNAMENIFMETEKAESGKIHIHLLPGEALCLINGECKKQIEKLKIASDKKEIVETWHVRLYSYTDLDSCEKELRMEELEDIYQYCPNFSGIIKYETEVDISSNMVKKELIELMIPEVEEGVMVYVNEQYCGAYVASPYKFNITDAIKEGKNTIRIEVTTNLYYSQRDIMSQVSPLHPMGILGKVYLVD